MSKAPDQKPGQPLKPGAKPATAPAPARKELTAHQKSMLGSGFVDSGAARRRDTMLSGMPARTTKDDMPAAQLAAPVSPSDLTTRDVWKAIVAPVQSAEGHRSRQSYEKVLAQFNIASNPRYDPDAPDKPRGHIFVWDVTRAMGCEIPHFVGAKELSLPQTCDWLRHEGPMRGWRKLNEVEVYDAAKAGYPIIAVPREIRFRQMAFIHPQDPTGTKPLCMGAGLKRGINLSTPDVLGVRLIDYFGHE